MNKAFYYYSLAAGLLFVGLAVYIFFFDKMLHANLGNTKANIFGALMLAYGGFRVWRSTKLNKGN